MNTGIRLHDVAGDGFEQKAANAREMGYGCVHLALSKVLGAGHAMPPAMTPGLAQYVKGALGPLHTAVLGCYLNLAHPDEQVYEQTLQRYIAHLRFAGWLGAGVVGTETENPTPDNTFDPAISHSEASLRLFIERLRPAVQAAERFGAVLAIEPVYRHIVCDAVRARRVLDEIGSPNLMVILDPVNLLDAGNLKNRDAILDEALDLLLDDTAVLHVKDYVRADGKLKAVAAGLGEMDWQRLLLRVAARKPHMQVTLENTLPENAAEAGLLVRRLWRGAV